MLLFLAALALVAAVYVYLGTTRDIEGLQVYNPNVYLPVSAVPPPIPPPPALNKQIPDPSTRGLIEPSPGPAGIPGPLASAPYLAIARTSPQPYQDPSLERTTRQRILNVLEDVKGFLAFEAQEIADISDPSVQLPLTTLRGDFQRLESEANALQRNPGLQPLLTQEDMDEISANLGYLQEKVRLMGTAGVLKIPSDPILQWTSPVVAPTTEGFQGAEAEGGAGARATPEQLEAFLVRLGSEIKRLSASGTTDPVTVARIASLTKIQQTVTPILDQVRAGTLAQRDVPIYQADIQRALPVMGDPAAPLPQIIRHLSLPAGLANLLPPNVSGDPAVQQQIGRLVDTYAGEVVNGVSFQLKYTSPREAAVAAAAAAPPVGGSASTPSTVATTGFPSVADIMAASSAPQFQPAPAPQATTDPYAINPVEGQRGPAEFDWFGRVLHITGQIVRRGIDLSTFGAFSEEALGNIRRTDSQFSWKGYAQMLCTRLEASWDPALPQTCGCPPPEWPGWRGGL